MIDTLFVPIVVAVLIIAIAFGYFVLTQISKPLYEATGVSIFNLENTAFQTAFKFLVISIYFGLPIVAVVLSFLSGINPIFLPIGVILLVISPFIFGIMKSVMINILSSHEFFVSFFSDPILGISLEYFPLIMTIFGALIIFTQFLVSREQA